MARSPELEARIQAAREGYAATRDDPMTPQFLTSRGQSGSMLDYQESEEIGKMICAEEGHRLNTDGTFCSCCGGRLCGSCGHELLRYFPQPDMPCPSCGKAIRP